VAPDCAQVGAGWCGGWVTIGVGGIGIGCCVWWHGKRFIALIEDVFL